MRYRDSVYILKACQMSFNGVKNNDIAKELGVTPLGCLSLAKTATLERVS